MRADRRGPGKHRGRQDPRQKAWVALCLSFVLVAGLAGSTYLIVGSLHTRSTLQTFPGGVQTTGRVVGVHVDEEKAGPVFGPVVSFTDRTGHAFVFTGPTSSARPIIGSSATVSYDPTDPADAHYVSDGSGSWKWRFSTGLFILILCVGGLLVIGAMRARQAPRPGTAAV